MVASCCFKSKVLRNHIFSQKMVSYWVPGHKDWVIGGATRKAPCNEKAPAEPRSVGNFGRRKLNLLDWIENCWGLWCFWAPKTSGCGLLGMTLDSLPKDLLFASDLALIVTKKMCLFLARLACMSSSSTLSCDNPLNWKQDRERARLPHDFFSCKYEGCLMFY